MSESILKDFTYPDGTIDFVGLRAYLARLSLDVEIRAALSPGREKP